MSGDFRTAFQAAVREAAGTISPRGLEYVHHLVLRLARSGAAMPGGPSEGMRPAAPGAPPGRPRAVGAEELCRVFRDRAAADFGAAAGHVVRRWGLSSGGDLGRAVFLLAGKKCLNLEAGETLDDYAAAGQFRFD